MELQPVFASNMTPPMTPHAFLGGFPCDGPYMREVFGQPVNLFYFGWFRRMPAKLRALAMASRAWNQLHNVKALPSVFERGINSQLEIVAAHAVDENQDLIELGWYDEEGFELDPETRRRLTDDELLAASGAAEVDYPLADSTAEDFDGEIPNPATWMPAPPPAPVQAAPVDLPAARAEIERRGIESVGRLGYDRKELRDGITDEMVKRVAAVHALGYTLDNWAADELSEPEAMKFAELAA